MVLMKRSALATTLLAQDDAERAERMFEEGLASARRLKSHSLTYVALYHPAQLAMAQRDLETAASILGEAMGPSQQTKDSANLAYFVQALAAVEAFREEAERSAVLLGAADALLREVGTPVCSFYNPDPSLRDRGVSESRSVLGDAAFEETQMRGQAMTFELAVGTPSRTTKPSPNEQPAGPVVLGPDREE
jgi:hypothetical protein